MNYGRCCYGPSKGRLCSRCHVWHLEFVRNPEVIVCNFIRNWRASVTTILKQDLFHSANILICEHHRRQVPQPGRWPEAWVPVHDTAGRARCNSGLGSAWWPSRRIHSAGGEGIQVLWRVRSSMLSLFSRIGGLPSRAGLRELSFVDSFDVTQGFQMRRFIRAGRCAPFVLGAVWLYWLFTWNLDPLIDLFSWFHNDITSGKLIIGQTRFFQ